MPALPLHATLPRCVLHGDDDDASSCCHVPYSGGGSCQGRNIAYISRTPITPFDSCHPCLQDVSCPTSVIACCVLPEAFRVWSHHLRNDCVIVMPVGRRGWKFSLCRIAAAVFRCRRAEHPTTQLPVENSLGRAIHHGERIFGGASQRDSVGSHDDGWIPGLPALQLPQWPEPELHALRRAADRQARLSGGACSAVPRHATETISCWQPRVCRHSAAAQTRAVSVQRANWRQSLRDGISFL